MERPAITTMAAVAALAGVATLSATYSGRRASARAHWQPPSGPTIHTSTLDARVVGAAGPPIVLLHGLVASGVFWGATYDRLADDHRLIIPDLLGFGRSPRPAAGYRPDDHVDALVSCLDDLGVTEPALIGAHSLGTLIALRLAATHPGRVSSIVAFGPPVYPDTAAAKAHVSATGPMARLLVLPGDTAEIVCRWVCRHREVAGRLAVIANPGLPAPVAADAVQHSWASYSQTLERVLLAADAPTWLDDVQCPVRLVAGVDDPVVDHAFLGRLAARHANVTVERWDGGHELPLARAEDCVKVLRRATAALSDS